MTSRLEQLERLVQLKDAGALTVDEFEAEKAKILGAQEARANAIPPAAEAVELNDEVEPDEVSWNPFQRPADVAVAERLSRFGLLSGGLLIVCDLTLVGSLALKSLTGATSDDGSTYASLFLPGVGFLLAVLAIDVGLTLASWRGRSRWSAIGLLLMSALAASGSMLEIIDGRTLWRVIQLVVTVGAFFFAIQAVRGAFWLKAMGGLAGVRGQRAETEREMARAFDAQMPAAARRRWLMIMGGVAVVVVAIGVVSKIAGGAGGEGGGQGVAVAAADDASVPTMAAPTAPPYTTAELSLPRLAPGQPFAQARQQLISAGYAPMPINLNGECPGNLCQIYPEVMECVATWSMWVSADRDLHAPCTLRYRREADGAWIIVRTAGEYIPVLGSQDVEFHDMAVMNAQDQRMVTEIEQEYANPPSY